MGAKGVLRILVPGLAALTTAKKSSGRVRLNAPKQVSDKSEQHASRDVGSYLGVPILESLRSPSLLVN